MFKILVVSMTRDSSTFGSSCAITQMIIEFNTIDGARLAIKNINSLWSATHYTTNASPLNFTMD